MESIGYIMLYMYIYRSTRLYNQPQCSARLYSGPLDCFAKTFRAEGLGASFYYREYIYIYVSPAKRQVRI